MLFPAEAGGSRRRWRAELGITEYPAPAGGCMLTDPNLAVRIRQYFNDRFFWEK
jgi:tRNA-uridine 2-sulfurtransferase